MKKAETWLRNLYAYGESQLSSSLFGTESDLKKQLPPELRIKSSLIEEISSYRVRKYKSLYFDSKKEVSYEKVVKETNMRGIAIWKPVWDYLISKVNDAYVFHSKSLFLQAKQSLIVHGRDYGEVFDYYLAGVVPDSPNLFQKLHADYQQKDKHIAILSNINLWTLAFSFVAILLAVSVNKWIGVGLFLVAILVLGFMFYLRNKTFGYYLFNSRGSILKTLFPKKRLFTDDLGEYYANGYPVKAVEVDVFDDKMAGVLYHQYLIRKDQNPCYLQLGKYVSLSLKEGNTFKPLISKEKPMKPLMYFEEEEIVIIPFESCNHPFMDYLIKHIDISHLDVPIIIRDYLVQKLDIPQEIL